MARKRPDGRYGICGVMGPDEFHTAYPGADPAAEGGLDNNATTNGMVSWLLSRAFDVLDLIPSDQRRRLREKLNLDDEELARWEETQPQAVRPLPRRRHHQSVRGIREPEGVRLGRLPREARQPAAPRPDP